MLTIDQIAIEAASLAYDEVGNSGEIIRHTDYEANGFATDSHDSLEGRVLGSGPINLH